MKNMLDEFKDRGIRRADRQTRFFANATLFSDGPGGRAAGRSCLLGCAAVDDGFDC
ncbi:hypothetical protein BH20ACT23_BH20ACT23_21810 [soil metagenome]